MTHAIPDAIREVGISENEPDPNLENPNIVDGLFAIARSLDRVAIMLDKLGTNGAADPKGAIEFLAIEIKAGLDRVGDALEHND